MANAKPKIKCYALQHMYREYALYDLAMRLTSGGKNTLYFDGRKMAKRMYGASKDSVYRDRDKLVAAGWFLPIKLKNTHHNTDRKGRHHRSDGSGFYSATQYRVLTHDEWVARHGIGPCAHEDDLACLENATGSESKACLENETRPVSKTRLTCLENAFEPVAPARHISVSTKPLYKENSMQTYSVVRLSTETEGKEEKQDAESTEGTPYEPPVSKTRQATQEPVSKTRQDEPFAPVQTGAAVLNAVIEASAPTSNEIRLERFQRLPMAQRMSLNNQYQGDPPLEAIDRCLAALGTAQ